MVNPKALYWVEAPVPKAVPTLVVAAKLEMITSALAKGARLRPSAARPSEKRVFMRIVREGVWQEGKSTSSGAHPSILREVLEFSNQGTGSHANKRSGRLIFTPTVAGLG